LPIWYKNEPDAAKRTMTMLIYEDDGVTPAPKATAFSTGSGGNTQIRSSGGSYAYAIGMLTNVGVDGEWEYEAAQSETNVDAAEIVVLVTASGYIASRAIATLQDPNNSEVIAGIASAIWDALPSAHTNAGTYGELCARPTGAVATSVSNTNASFATNLTASTAGFYNDAFCCFLSGACAGQTHKVTGYVPTGGILSFASTFATTPSAGDRFILVNR
jgi:hypothetical protein